ncbi:MAG: tyrosine-type recombinase/integrase, partial [Planctomycetales bacterium]|nr:tyrosine-type recombinase/integrase [Planctomycetales bacterium]
MVSFVESCNSQQLPLRSLTPYHIAAYIEQLATTHAAPSVKQHLAALRMLGDYLVVGQIVPHNPASAVRGPKYVAKKGKTPVLTSEEARQFFDAINIDTLIGLRDRALCGVLVYSFARITAVLNMNVQDYFHQGRRSWLRLHEKNGKYHEVPVHHTAQEYLDAYINAAELTDFPKTPLFRTVTRQRTLSDKRLSPREALAMIKRRAVAANIGDHIGCHSFRATGITNFLQNGGSLENAQAIAAPRKPPDHQTLRPHTRRDQPGRDRTHSVLDVRTRVYHFTSHTTACPGSSCMAWCSSASM